MIITGNVDKVRNEIEKARKRNELVGFVPTMGALHQGHLSLVKKAKAECDFSVVSIFVNPAQFEPGEDYSKYPRNFKEDEKLLKEKGVDLLFYPEISVMYPKGFSTYVDEIDLSKVLCGKSRPNHFKGVCTIVAKLFNIIQPDIAFVGQKDYQQALIIRRLIRDLNFPIEIKILPIIREENGLAISSRNVYLKPIQKKESICLYEALTKAKECIRKGERSVKKIISKMRKIVESGKSTKIDYVEIVNANTLEKVKKAKGRILIALAVYIGKVRLIDNMIIVV